MKNSEAAFSGKNTECLTTLYFYENGNVITIIDAVGSGTTGQELTENLSKLKLFRRSTSHK